MQSIQVLKLGARMLALAALVLLNVSCVKADEELKVGTKAPDFSLPAYPNGTVSLQDFLGKKNVVLAFYPKDQTLFCTREMCGFSQELNKYADKNTAVLGISFDSVASHEAFAAKNNLKQTLLSDEGGKVAQLYGAAKGDSHANRILFLIDKQGLIQYVHKGMPDDKELIAAIDQVEAPTASTDSAKQSSTSSAPKEADKSAAQESVDSSGQSSSQTTSK